MPVRAAAGRNTYQASPVESVCEEAEILGTTIKSDTRSPQAKLKQKCLWRDGYRCIITKYRDGKSLLNADTSEALKIRKTRVSHIIPACIFSFDVKSHREVFLALTLLTGRWLL